MRSFVRFCQYLTADPHRTSAPAPSVPDSLTRPVATAVSVICGTGSVARTISVIGTVGGCGADKRADGKAADDAGGDGATVTCFGWLWRSDSCESNGRGGRESSQGFGCHSHGSPLVR